MLSSLSHPVVVLATSHPSNADRIQRVEDDNTNDRKSRPESSSLSQKKHADQNDLFQQLVATVTLSSKRSSNNNNEPILLRLDQDSNGVRGVYLNRDFQQGETIVSIPLRFCLRDDEPPDWMMDDDNENENDDDDNPELADFDWATRLAASVVDVQLQQQQQQQTENDNSLIARSLWLSLLPNPVYLRASLPVHWPEDILRTAKCTDLELAVDSAFFSRAMAVQDVLDALPKTTDSTEADQQQGLSDLVENSFDVVQTRSCRVLLQDDNSVDDNVQEGKPVRLLAPVFDLINHHPTQPNAEFVVMKSPSSKDDDNDDENCLVVKALVDCPKDGQVLIDYGESARPDWKCLQSYGFVPPFEPSSTDCNSDDHTAELFLEGQRFYVGPDSVSQELVQAMALAMSGVVEEGKVTLTPEIALRLAQRIAESAFQILLDNPGASDDESTASEDDDDDKGLPETHDTPESAETVISERLAASLTFNQHRVLMACSLGLRDWAVKHPKPGNP